MYIWLLLKLFLGRVYEQEKKNPNVSNYEVVTSLSDVYWLIEFSIIRMT